MSRKVDLTQGAKNKVRKWVLPVHSCRGSWISSATYHEARDGLASSGNRWESTPDSRSGDASELLDCLLAPLSQMSYFRGACLGPALRGQERLGCVRRFPLGHADP